MNSARRSPRTHLIIPTSLCAGQVGKMIADKLNARPAKEAARYVALPHTEGCGVSGEAIDILERVIAGYAVHPLAERTLLLEHGCEKTHNDAIRNFLTAHSLDYSRLGFASIQLDGGIEKVTEKVTQWFEGGGAAEAEHESTGERQKGSQGLRIGITAHGEIPDQAASAFATLANALARSDGTVVVPQNSPLLKSTAFTAELFDTAPTPTLAYAELAQKTGFHIMEMAGEHLVEALTGLGATGAEVLLVYSGDGPVQGHPLVPTVQVTCAAPASEVDLVLNQSDPAASAQALAELLTAVLRGERTPRAQLAGNVDFQVSRGWLGVST